MTLTNIAMSRCPKFHTCNAPICPLDLEWQKRKHTGEDRVCFYLIESQKTDAKAIFEGGGKGYLYNLITKVVQPISNHYSHIKHALLKAKKTGSRMTKVFGNQQNILGSRL